MPAAEIINLLISKCSERILLQNRVAQTLLVNRVQIFLFNFGSWFVDSGDRWASNPICLLVISLSLKSFSVSLYFYCWEERGISSRYSN